MDEPTGVTAWWEFCAGRCECQKTLVEERVVPGLEVWSRRAGYRSTPPTFLGRSEPIWGRALADDLARMQDRTKGDREMRRFMWLFGCVCTAAPALLGLGCGGSTREATEALAPTATAEAPPTASAVATAAPTAVTAAAPRDIAGDYDVTGTNANGGGSYKGGLSIVKHGDSYRFTWVSGGATYFGVGVQTDATVAVSYTEEKDGKGCGVQLYKIGPNGSLNGKSAYWGSETNETELGARVSGADLPGEYDVMGVAPDGTQFKARLTVAASGPGFTFDWKGPNTALHGRGVRKGDMVTAGFGRSQCSFVAYDVMPDGSLDGQWGGVGTTSLGTEKAIRK